VISEEHVKQAPVVFDGIYQSQMGDPKGDKMVELSGSYAKKFNKPLTLSWFVATGYDSVKLIALCSKKVGARPVAVRDCIAHTKGLIGVSQTFSFNEGGSSPQQESVFQLRQGKFTLAE
jgi:ABC-type branched-subunit amino acid transport system substrate-binding protein